MNNILVSLKKFFTNKNTVTVIGVIAILGLLYWGYNSVINEQVKPVRIPVAKTTIQPRTLITDDMITYINVPQAALTNNVIRTSTSIVNMYTAVNTVIPAGSMFYNETLVKKEQLPGNVFTEVKEGERPYALAVTLKTTYYNEIDVGMDVDIYMKATDESGQVMVGMLLENMTVLAVKDSAGNNVFEDASANRTPATLMFGVPEDIFILLKKTEYLKSFGVELFPVPKGGEVPTGDLVKGKEELIDFINSNTVVLSEDNDTPNDTQPENGNE